MDVVVGDLVDDLVDDLVYDVVDVVLGVGVIGRQRCGIVNQGY